MRLAKTSQEAYESMSKFLLARFWRRMLLSLYFSLLFLRRPMSHPVDRGVTSTATFCTAQSAERMALNLLVSGSPSRWVCAVVYRILFGQMPLWRQTMSVIRAPVV